MEVRIPVRLPPGEVAGRSIDGAATDLGALESKRNLLAGIKGRHVNVDANGWITKWIARIDDRIVEAGGDRARIH